MSWKCESCGPKLIGKEKYCPECAAKTVYRCKKCGKIMEDGKHNLCPMCNTERAEKRGDALKKFGECVAVVGSVAIAILTKGKHGGGKA